MIRLWTYLTLVGGLPTVAGTYYDLQYADIDVDMGENTKVITARNGMPLVLNDAQYQLPVAASFMLSTAHMDKRSETQYLGDYRYIASALYVHYMTHTPVCIFSRNIREQAMKVLLCYFAPRGYDRALAGQVTAITEDRTHLSRINPVRAFNFNFVVVRDGTFTDWDDITSASWLDRF